MRFKNLELLQKWYTPAGMQAVYPLLEHKPSSAKNLEARYDTLNLPLLTGSPKKCSICERGPHRGMQIFKDTGRNHEYLTVMGLMLRVLGSRFNEFTNQLLGDFYYTDGTLNELADLNISVADVASKNYACLVKYGSITNKPLKKFIGRDRDIQKVALQIYENSMGIDWTVAPTKGNDPVTRLDTKTIAKQTKVPLAKVQNITVILKMFHAIAEVSVRDMSKPYFQRYIDVHATYLHTPVYVLFDINDPDIKWDLANQLGLSGSSRVSKSAIQYFFGEEYLQAMYPDQRNTSVQLLYMQAFGKIIEDNKGKIAVTELLDQAMAAVPDEISESGLKSTWQSFKLFLPLHKLQLVTASEAAKQGIKVKNAKGREKVVITA
ncbi:hypothetical protein FXE12_12300 [Lactobacillus sp. SL9-6]|nr:hypothetical protein FXE12_12300 [Lactobacillus sp. SL9-6]